MISLRKVLLTASLAVLVTGGPQVAVADSMPMMSTSSSAEIGHVQWDWWRNQTAAGDYTRCDDHATTMATSPEIGPVGWKWFEDAHQHARTGQPMMSRELNSEIGSGAPPWRQSGQKAEVRMPIVQHC